jgi:hypothetical protein
MVVLTSHLTLVHTTTRPCMAGHRLIPLDIPVPSKGMRWLVWRPRVVWFDGWWAVSQDRPWLGVTYVRVMLSGSDLWVKCTCSVELEIHSNGRVLNIG